MTDSADLVLLDGRVHTLAVPDSGDPRTWPGALAPDAPNEAPEPDGTAVAIRDGTIVRVGSDRAVRRLIGVETTEIELDGATLLPGFIDAHTHLVHTGLALVHVDLSTADSREAALAMLDERASSSEEGWVVGMRYDESTWADDRQPTRDELDAIAADRPVAAVREDMHTAVGNSVVLERLDDPADEHLETDDAGEPTGLLREDAVGVIEPVFDPDVDATEAAARAAIDQAIARGITGVHDKVRHSHAPRVYRALDREGELDCRVRIDYWSDHRDALAELGLRTGDGSPFVQVGSLKTFTDGSIGGRTAKLREPYADADEGSGAGNADHDGGGDTADPADGLGTWVAKPAELREVVADADDAGLQVQAHAIGDAAIGEAIDALAAADPRRHRIEHVELVTDEQIDRMAAAGLVASMQPNFHRWAREGGLYETALGPERTRRSNRLRRMATAGVPLAFGSDGMPMDPLYGIEEAVTAPTDAQSLSLGAALVAYTGGSAYAGFDEDRVGSIEPGNRADLVVLADSPWRDPEAVGEIDVVLSVVDGAIVHDDASQ